MPAGRLEFRKGGSECRSCGVYQRQSLGDFVRMGAWPCTPDPDRFETVIDQRVLARFDLLRQKCLHLSTRAFLEALAEEAVAYGGQVRILNRRTSAVYRDTRW